MTEKERNREKKTELKARELSLLLNCVIPSIIATLQIGRKNEQIASNANNSTHDPQNIRERERERERKRERGRERESGRECDRTKEIVGKE